MKQKKHPQYFSTEPILSAANTSESFPTADAQYENIITIYLTNIRLIV